MAYCVHCGVKLGGSERRCPLCGTQVLDPAEPEVSAVPRAYPVRTPEQELKRNKRFLLVVAGLMLLLPGLLCLVIDFLLGGGITWSIYAATALWLLFIAVAVPLTVTRFRAYLSLGTAFLCLSAYLFLVELFSRSGPWFFPVVFPSLVLAAGLILLLIVLFRRGKLNKLTMLAASLASVAVQCLLVEWLISRALGSEILFLWSPYVLAPCLFIALWLFFINGNRAVREEVRRRLHF